jgi:hypothetical protein
VELTGILMHELNNIHLQRIQPAKQLRLGVVLRMLLAYEKMLFEFELHEGSPTIGTILREQLHLLLLLELIENPLTLLAIGQMPLEQINIQNTHTDGALLKYLLVVFGLGKRLLAGDAVCVGLVVHHCAQRAEDHELH